MDDSYAVLVEPENVLAPVRRLLRFAGLFPLGCNDGDAPDNADKLVRAFGLSLVELLGAAVPGAFR